MKSNPADLALRRALGEALRSLRKQRKISQEALAHEAGVSRSYMSRLERGGPDAGLWMLWRLKDALKITLGRLVRLLVAIGKTLPPGTDAKRGDKRGK